MIFNNKNTTDTRIWYSLLVELKKINLLRILSYSSFIFVLLLSACGSQGAPDKENNRLIAQVFNKSLFQSELNELIGEAATPEDSTQIAKAYIEKWVREAVLMHEAEKYVPKDLNIDALVRDYRASLIRHNYEKLLVEMTLDSTINETDLNNYYQENKEQYKLKQPIIQCHFIKVPKPAENWSEVKKWWKSDEEEDYRRLLDYCSRNTEIYLLDQSVWYYLNDISQYLPKGTLSANNYKSRKNISTNDDNYEYLLKIFQTTPAGEYAPLAFIQNQATKVILHKRKINLLEEKKEEMYERERGNVKIYLE